MDIKTVVSFDDHRKNGVGSAIAYVAERLEEGVAFRMASRPFHHAHPSDPKVLVYGLDEYLKGADEDGQLVLGAVEHPTGWVCYRVNSLNINVYGPGFRVVDVELRVAPLHDGHARFADVLYQMTARLSE